MHAYTQNALALTATRAHLNKVSIFTRASDVHLADKMPSKRGGAGEPMLEANRWCETAERRRDRSIPSSTWVGVATTNSVLRTGRFRGAPSLRGAVRRGGRFSAYFLGSKAFFLVGSVLAFAAVLPNSLPAFLGKCPSVVSSS